MVKVLPTAFTLFEKQNIFNAPSEPLCVHCSEDYVFIACEGCVIEAHDLKKNEKMARLRTILPVSELVYNPLGDCIVSLERRTPESPASVRIYFKWRVIRELETPTRVITLTSPAHGGHAPLILPPVVDAEVLELPVEGVSCLAVCRLTGTIAVGSDKTVRLFTLRRGRGDVPTASLSTGGFSIVAYMDVITDMKLKKICICGHYLACVSTHRVRVLKILMLGPPGVQLPWEQFQLDSTHAKRHARSRTHKSVSGQEEYKNDGNFLCWSPSYVWEAEARGRGSTEMSPPPTPLVTTSDEKSKSSLPHPFLMDKTTPLIGTISVPSISSSSTSSFKRDPAKTTELEILGPVEYIWGQPVSVVLHGDGGGGAGGRAREETKCWVVTMLYRRLASSGFSYVHTSSSSSSGGEGRERAATLDPSSGIGTDRVTGSVKPKTKGGIHSVQLVPSFTNEGSVGGKKLVGMSCIFSNRSKGYIYDVFSKTKQVTVLSFMTRCQTMSYDGQFLHSLSTDSESLDSYTCRVSASVLTNNSFTNGHINTSQWLKQPCPPSSLELTLISSNKFLGCMALTSSTNHVVVFCKDTSLPDSNLSPERPSLLQSFSLRRPKVLSTVAWNVYVLVKKPITDMIKQFSESAHTLGVGIPPVLQHHLSEAHILLRSLIIEGDDSSDELNEMLCQNCFDLADSFCLYSVDETALNNAAGYFVLSGRPISDVVQHIKKKYSDSPITTPFDILMKYLKLVLFDSKNRPDQLEKLQPMASDILELYAKFDPQHFGDFLLYSWLEIEARERVLELCELLLSNISQQEKTTNVTTMAMIKILCDLDRRDKASEMLSKMSESFILSWSKANPHFLLSKESTLTPLGKIIMGKLDESFLSFFLYLFENDSLSLDVVTTALKGTTGKSSDASPMESLLLKQFLEDVLLQKASTTARGIAQSAVLLAEVLYWRVVGEVHVKTSPFIEFGPRHVWLNEIKPFENTDGEYSSDNVLYTSPKSQSNLIDLIELQSLLCSAHMSEDIAACINELLEEEGDNNTVTITISDTTDTTRSYNSDTKSIISLSLRLLVWPHLNKLTEATSLVLQYCPHILVDYCKCYYQLRLEQWKWLLNELTDRIKKNPPTTTPSKNNTQDLIKIYKDVLFHVVTLTSPEEFFTLLPSNGSIGFFLPLIERSCNLYLAKRISSHLHTSLPTSPVPPDHSL